MRLNRIGPNIVISYDKSHNDPNEARLTHRLVEIKPEEKMIVFDESRHVEVKNIYSLELLQKDNPYSTASSAMLLAAHIMAASGLKEYVVFLLANIYSDEYFKKLFMGDHYTKYNPIHYGLCQSVDPRSPFAGGALPYSNLPPTWKNTVVFLKGLFVVLDEDLKKIEKEEHHSVIGATFTKASEAISDKNRSMSLAFILGLAEALAVIKISKIQQTLGKKFDSSKEVSLNLLRKLYQGSDSVGELNNALIIKYRTKSQAEKVIKVIESFFEKNPNDQEHIFVVRVGVGHKKLTQTLQEYFKEGSIKELDLKECDFSHIEENIRSHFNRLSEEESQLVFNENS